MHIKSVKIIIFSNGVHFNGFCLNLMGKTKSHLTKIFRVTFPIKHIHIYTGYLICLFFSITFYTTNTVEPR